MNRIRSGTVLIIVTGLSTLLASLTLALLANMRSDQEESALMLREAQARIMLDAALSYVAETARLGWDDPATPMHEEAFGWRDLRDGSVGPRDQLGNRLFVGDAAGIGAAWPAIDDPAAPLPAAVRCPAFVMERPPQAVSRVISPNAVAPGPGETWEQLMNKSWADLINFTNYDPRPAATDPALVDGPPAQVDAAWRAFMAGDLRPRPESMDRAWFRVLRRSVTEFVITCGAGGSQGFATWQEVQAAGATTTFGDQATFDTIRREEVVLWFAAEWNPSVSHNLTTHYDAAELGSSGATNTLHLNVLSMPVVFGRDKPNSRNFTGTFTWYARLLDEPPRW